MDESVRRQERIYDVETRRSLVLTPQLDDDNTLRHAPTTCTYIIPQLGHVARQKTTVGSNDTPSSRSNRKRPNYRQGWPPPTIM